MFMVGRRTNDRMIQCHPLLRACVVLAMRRYSAVDFGVGAYAARTEQEQRAFVRSGKSKNMNSKHLIQPDGYSHAVDLYPVGYTNGLTQTEIKSAFQDIANAMQEAAERLSIVLVQGIYWGWDSPHHEIKTIL